MTRFNTTQTQVFTIMKIASTKAPAIKWLSSKHLPGAPIQTLPNLFRMRIACKLISLKKITNFFKKFNGFWKFKRPQTSAVSNAHFKKAKNSSSQKRKHFHFLTVFIWIPSFEQTTRVKVVIAKLVFTRQAWEKHEKCRTSKVLFWETFKNVAKILTIFIFLRAFRRRPQEKQFTSALRKWIHEPQWSDSDEHPKLDIL